jgi:hypothetical protein
MILKGLSQVEALVLHAIEALGSANPQLQAAIRPLAQELAHWVGQNLTPFLNPFFSNPVDFIGVGFWAAALAFLASILLAVVGLITKK